MMEKGIQTTIAAWLGGILLLVGIIGFLNNPLLGVFGVNAAHNLVHLIAGAAGVWAGVWGGTRPSRGYHRVFGTAFAVLAVLGFIGTISVVGVLNLNTADNWLHMLLGIFQLVVGFGMKD